MQNLLVLPLLISFIFSPACSRTNPDTSPQTKAAQYGTAILTAANEIQKVVNTLAANNPNTIEVGRKITAINEDISRHAGTLEKILVAYDSAVTIGEKEKLIGEVNSNLKEISGLITAILNLQPDNQIVQLASNVLKLILAISAEIR